MKMIRRLTVGFVALFLVAGPTWAETVEQTLANGLKVIVKTDRRAPVVVSQIWYKAGSMDESTGTTGVAHATEHMMFKGTKKVPGGEFSRLIAAAGGQENAFTAAITPPISRPCPPTGWPCRSGWNRTGWPISPCPPTISPRKSRW